MLATTGFLAASWQSSLHIRSELVASLRLQFQVRALLRCNGFSHSPCRGPISCRIMRGIGLR